MAQPIASRTRTQIRQAIGRNISMGGNPIAVFGTASGNGSTSTLVDTYGLIKFADDALIGYQVYLVVTATGAIEKAWVTDNVSSTGTITFAPVRTSTTTSQVYELWQRPFFTEDIHDLIDQAIIDASDEALVERSDTSLITEPDQTEYAVPSGLVAIHKVECVYSDNSKLLSDCNTAWTAGTNSTVTADTAEYQTSSGSNKIVVGAAASTNETVAVVDLPATTNLSGYDTVEMWVKSTVALTAADYAFTFVNFVALGSLSFPAVTANVWTKLQLTISSPQTYSAVASIAITQVVDKGAMTLWIDDVRILNSASRKYYRLPPNDWSIVKGSTAYLKLSSYIFNSIGSNKLLRLSGYEKPDLMSADTSTSEVDPNFIINTVTARLLATQTNREEDAKYYFSLIDKASIKTPLSPYTRMVT